MQATPATKAIPIVLHKTQHAFCNAPEVFTGYVGGRGTGKSKAGSWKLSKLAKPGRLYLACAPTYKMLRDSTMRSFTETAKDTSRLIKLYRGGDNPRAEIRCNDGGKAEVIFRSTDDPDSLRGPNYSGIWADEASLMDEEAFDVMIACLREAGEQGWFAGTFTPKGKRHWTYRVFAEKPIPSTQVFHSKTSENPFLPANFEENLRHRYTHEKARQELGGEWLDNEGQLIPYEQMMAVTESRCEWKDGAETANHGPLFVGWDLGRSRNRSVIWTWELVGDIAWCRECFVMHQTSYEVQEEEFKKRIYRRQVAKVVIDKGITGAVFADRYSRLLGSRFEGVHLSDVMMGYVAELFANAVEKRMVRLPDDDAIRDDFSLVGKPEPRNGKSVLPADKVEEDDDGGHADRFWAAALAYKAIEEKSAPTNFARVRAPRAMVPNI